MTTINIKRIFLAVVVFGEFRIRGGGGEEGGSQQRLRYPTGKTPCLMAFFFVTSVNETGKLATSRVECNLLQMEN